MLEVPAALVDTRERGEARGVAPPESRDLREHEPHPVATLPPCSELSQGLLRAAAVLGVDEPV